LVTNNVISKISNQNVMLIILLTG